ncbi:hypothetical protein GGR21_002086 [Dysgonomonas hofstadii]|uniref:DUF4249 domain-containing protein n=1 Tax=Dysgonomonas hofstadii TaxID=637886 RepID=A0A840CTJ8_9BACT|nr:DUF4249 domain-containing protein [Dysgonomonas hofstadii]MBB4036185.1 hypothetical protein [Dysgonomonas hofstadii]
MKNVIYIFLMLLFVSCVEEFSPKGIDEASNLLIVDGIISEGETTIKLTRSVGLNDNTSNVKLVMNAQMRIECTDGTTFPFALNSNYGDYTAFIDELKAGQKYRLIINLDGLEYQSDYMEPMETTEIDEIYVQKDDAEDVSVRVSTHGSEENSKYYRWTYNEIWEIQSRIKALGGIVADTLAMYDQVNGPINPGLYCWVYNESKGYSVATSESLSENRIIGKKIMETNENDERFSMLYYIEVKQNSLRKAAYDYIVNLEKNIEEMGSIFGPMPSEMKGNITCVTNPDNPVIGYVDVSTTTSKTFFYSYPNDVYIEGYIDGSLVCKIEEGYPDGSYGIVSFLPDPPPIQYTIAPLKCMDCRHNGGTKAKPPFWPNDHQ